MESNFFHLSYRKFPNHSNCKCGWTETLKAETVQSTLITSIFLILTSIDFSLLIVHSSKCLDLICQLQMDCIFNVYKRMNEIQMTLWCFNESEMSVCAISSFWITCIFEWFSPILSRIPNVPLSLQLKLGLLEPNTHPHWMVLLHLLLTQSGLHFPLFYTLMSTGNLVSIE